MMFDVCFPEPNYPQLLELLHVPLHTMYQSAPKSENGGGSGGGAGEGCPTNDSL